MYDIPGFVVNWMVTRNPSCAVTRSSEWVPTASIDSISRDAFAVSVMIVPRLTSRSQNWAFPLSFHRTLTLENHAGYIIMLLTLTGINGE